MKIRFPDPEIPVDGFSSGDLFQRKRLGESILALGSNVDDDLTILLDSPWGSGKTIFLRQFSNFANYHGFPVLYLDAFKHDIDGEALPAIAAEVLSRLDEVESTGQKLRAKFLSVVSMAGITLAKGATKAGISYLSGGVFSAASLKKVVESKEISQAIEAGISETLEQSAAALLQSSIEQKAESESQLSAVTEVLKNVASHLSEAIAVTDNRNHQKRIVFIVDELDRCRPDFAVDLLETIKHLFDSEKVMFILSADTTQLFNSIAHAYGSEIDAGRYLEKFYDVKYRLPENVGARNTVLETYAEHIKDSFPDDSSNGKYVAGTMKTLLMFSVDAGLSIRTFQKICQKFLLVVAQTDSNYLRVPHAIAILCFCETARPGIYEKLRNNSLNLHEFRREFPFLASSPETEEILIPLLEFALRQGTSVSSLSPRAQDWYNALSRYGLSEREPLFPVLSKKLIETFTLTENA